MQESQQKAKKVAKNSLFMFVRMAIVLCVGLYSSRVVLAALGVSDFGIYNVVGGVVILFAFLQQALTNAAYRFFAFELGRNNRDGLKKAFSTAINTHIILVVILLILSETIGLWIFKYKLSIPESRLDAAQIVYQLSVICFCSNVLRNPYHSAIVAREKLNFIALIGIIEAFLKLAAAYMLLATSSDKLILYANLILLISILTLVVYFIYCRINFAECKYQYIWDSKLISQMMGYSGWSILVNFVDIAVNQCTIFFFNAFSGVVANAAMGIANQVNGQMFQFLNSFSQSYNPQIIKAYAAKDLDYFIKLLFATSKFSYYLLAFVAVPVMLNIDFILELWLKNPPPGTSLFIILMLLYSLIDAYSAPLWIGVYATGNLRNHQILISCIKITNIPLAYILLRNGMPVWGALALKAAINFICSLVRPCYVKKLYGLPLNRYLKNVLFTIFFVSLISIPLPVYAATQIESGFWRLVLSSTIFLILFVPTVYMIGLEKFEKSFINSYLLKILNKIKK